MDGFYFNVFETFATGHQWAYSGVGWRSRDDAEAGAFNRVDPRLCRRVGVVRIKATK